MALCFDGSRVRDRARIVFAVLKGRPKEKGRLPGPLILYSRVYSRHGYCTPANREKVVSEKCPEKSDRT